MAKRRVVNKNLVAVLTVVGMSLAVGVVALATMKAARRDPQVYALRAAEAEKAGEYRRAAELYGRAFNVNRETKYSIDAARCLMSLGEIANALGFLIQAHAQDPGDVPLLEALLAQAWQLRAYDMATILRDHSTKLLEIDPNHVLALVSRSEALRALATLDPNYPRLADEALDRAIELKPEDPRVALCAASRTLREYQALLATRSREYTDPDLEARLAQLRDQALGGLRGAWEADPGNQELASEYARLLQIVDRDEESRQVLERAVEVNPTEASLHYRLAATLLSLAAQRRESAAPQPAESAAALDTPAGGHEGAAPETGAAAPSASETIEALLEKAARHAQEALRLEPAVYGAYGVLAEIEVFHRPRGRLSAEDAQRYENALAIFKDGLEKTVGLRSLRARLAEGAGERMMSVMSPAFEMAWDYWRRAGDEKQRESALAHMQYFVDQAVTEEPTFFVTSLLEGQMHFIKRDLRAAIRAYESAEQKTGDSRATAYWNRMAKERLAHLYAHEQVNEPGLAMRYVDQTLDAYELERRPPPVDLYALKAELLLRMDRNEDALNLIDKVAGQYPPYEPLRRMREAALVRTGRAAERPAGSTPPEAERSIAEQMFEASLAVEAKDWNRAAEKLEQVLEREPQNLRAVELYVGVMMQAQQREKAAALVRSLREQSTDERDRRRLAAFEVSLTTTDPAERDRRLEEIVRTIPDELERATELYNFYSSRDRLEEAAPHLDLVEKQRPDDPLILEQQFLLTLRLDRLDRAEQYAARLARLNADRAGGATYRARLKMARGDTAGALVEYSAARRERPTDSKLAYEIARALLASRPPRTEEALAALRDSVEFNPLNVEANIMAYSVLEQLGRRSEGVRYLEQAARLAPDNEFVRERQQLIDEEANPLKGVAQREKIRSEQPQNVDNLVRLAELYTRLYEDVRTAADVRTERSAKAVECLSAAAEIDAAHSDLARAAARYFAAAEQREQGEKFLRRCLAAQQGPAQLEGRVLLARFLERTGDAAAAEAELRAVVEAVPQVVTDPKARQLSQVAAGLELMDFYSRTNQVDAMIDTAGKVLNLLTEPDQIQRVQLRTIEGLIRARQFGKAGEYVARYVSDFPRDPRGQIIQVQLWLATPQPEPEKRRDALERSREQLTRVLRESRDHAFALYLRGSAALELARFHGQRDLLPEARTDLARVKSLEPRGLNLQHRLALAQLFELSGETDLAEIELRELLELEPDNPLLLSHLLNFYRGTGQLAKAHDYFNERMIRHPDNPLWAHQLGLLLIERGENSAAVRPLEAARALYEKNQQPTEGILLDLFQALLGSNRAQEAATHFEKLDDALRTPPVKAAAGQAYAKLNQTARAEALFEQALLEAARTNPTQLGIVVSRVGEALPLEAAATLWERMIAQAAAEPGVLDLQMLVAIQYVGRGEAPQLERAQALLEDVLARAEAGSLVYVSALAARAQLLEVLGQHEAAVREYEQLLRYDQNHVTALNNLAYALADRLGRPADALPYAERLQELSLRMSDAGMMSRELHVNVLDTIGWVFHLNGRSDSAASVLLESVRLAPGLVVSRYHLGVVYAKMGRTAEARQELERARLVAQQRRESTYLEAIQKALSELP
jgi:tetratricopeptide (TPR) repeat protein